MQRVQVALPRNREGAAGFPGEQDAIAVCVELEHDLERVGQRGRTHPRIAAREAGKGGAGVEQFPLPRAFGLEVADASADRLRVGLGHQIRHTDAGEEVRARKTERSDAHAGDETFSVPRQEQRGARVGGDVVDPDAELARHTHARVGRGPHQGATETLASLRGDGQAPSQQIGHPLQRGSALVDDEAARFRDDADRELEEIGGLEVDSRQPIALPCDELGLTLLDVERSPCIVDHARVPDEGQQRARAHLVAASPRILVHVDRREHAAVVLGETFVFLAVEEPRERHDATLASAGAPDPRDDGERSARQVDLPHELFGRCVG